MDSEELMQKTDLAKIAQEGSVIYERVRGDYETEHLGEFLSIEIESGKVYLGKSSSDAMVSARKAHPGKVFYVVKIGFEAAETMAHLFPDEE